MEHTLTLARPPADRPQPGKELSERDQGLLELDDHGRPQAHRHHVPGRRVCVAFLLGGIFALLVRLALLNPQHTLFGKHGGPRRRTTASSRCTARSWCSCSSSRRFPASLGNFVLPLMLGAKDVAFPRLNLASFYLWVIGAVLAHHRHDRRAPSTPAGPSTRPTAPPPTTRVTVDDSWRPSSWASRSIFTGLNFIVTIHKLRAPGMGWFEMPLFVWGIYATAIIQVLATPVLGDHAGAADDRARLPDRHLRSAHRRRSGAVPALLLVLLAPGRLHHDPAGHGDHQRDRSRPSAARRSSATAPSPTPASRSRCWASSCGATTCSSPANRDLANVVFSA